MAIGTSHIAKQSIQEVTQAIEIQNPRMICLEIDAKRLPGLFSKGNAKQSWRRIGTKGYIFALIASWAEKKLGDMVGTSPGEEMKTAITIAKEKSIPIALIDQDIEITLKRLSKTLSWKEKGRFIWDILKAVTTRKPDIEFDLRTVPEKRIIQVLISKVRERYPNVFRVLIEERNIYMAARIKEIISQHPNEKILVIVGAGHEEGITKLLSDYVIQ